MAPTFEVLEAMIRSVGSEYQRVLTRHVPDDSGLWLSSVLVLGSEVDADSSACWIGAAVPISGVGRLESDFKKALRAVNLRILRSISASEGGFSILADGSGDRGRV